MTNDELDRLDALAAAATRGPWKAAGLPSPRWIHTPSYVALAEALESRTRAEGKLDAEANAAFIAAARDAVPALVAEVRRLRGALHQIARRDDAEMAAAKTLHYDMRGWAQRALDGAA